MDTNYQLNYYDYGINLEIQGVMPVIGGGGVNPEPDTHEYVDLGLPSGTIWATCNIGASRPEETGLYFAWGGTQGYTAEQVGYGEGKKRFGLPDYEFGPDTAFTKYNKTDGKTVLDTEDDAAIANWGSEWKMPTKEQFEELTTNTTSAYTQIDGVNGLLCTSTANTNTLFFPAVGNAQYGDIVNSGAVGCYWSTYLDDENDEKAWIISFRDVNRDILTFYRYIGQNVRPVRK